jgi:hypothetical protein
VIACTPLLPGNPGAAFHPSLDGSKGSPLRGETLRGFYVAEVNNTDEALQQTLHEDMQQLARFPEHWRARRRCLGASRRMSCRLAESAAQVAVGGCTMNVLRPIREPYRAAPSRPRPGHTYHT